ncbi:MAG: cardiolipin synthase, partial [Desulfovibrionaceae bacterium]|nr:cardiolipin synthase [Desulfovibrionaceae bacterium]
RSLRLNFELNTEVFDRAFSSEMRTFMKETMQESREILPGEMESMSMPARLRSALFWLFSPYL